MPANQVHPLHPCLVALQTATGAVTFLVTRHPAAQIEHLGTQLEVSRSMVVTTPHAERIANELRTELADQVVSAWGNHPYFLADWEEVERLVGEFDHASGRRLRRGDVAVGDPVQVEIKTAAGDEARKARGEVSAIHGRRYLVRLERAIGDLVSVWAPRSLLKPVIRACALVAAA